MAFFTIFTTPGLEDADYRRALASGPNEVSTRHREHQEMLVAAGFREIEEIDLTAEFLVTARDWYEGRKRYAEELIAAHGEALYGEWQRDSSKQIAAIEAGLLRRALFVCS